MIHDLMDQLLPPASDDEDEDRPDIEFVFEAVPAATSSADDGRVADFSPPPRGVGADPTPSSCRTLVVCAPGGASAFMGTAFPLRPVPWSLRVKAEPARCLPKPPKPARFFVLEGDDREVAFALMDSPVPAEFAAAWVEALLEGFAGATQVVFMDRLFRAEFRVANGERPQEPHLCGLWTSAWTSPATQTGPRPCALASVSELPTPNVVEGVAAALLAQCESERKRCLVALALQDGAHLSAASLQAFERLTPTFEEFGLLPLAGDKKWPPSCRAALEQVVPPASMSIYA